MTLLPGTTRGLWAAFGVFVGLNLVFLAVMQGYGFVIIDEMWQPATVAAHVEAMSDTQRRAHAWLTGTADVAYPFAYAALLGGLAVRAFPDHEWLAFPILLCVPVDLIEALSQVMILTGADMDPWLAVKSIATPIKLVLFVAGVLIGLAALFVLWRRRRARRAA